MVRLLVSVRDASEAIEALRGGAHIIDIKEPSAGSLGAATSRVWKEVLDVVPCHVPCSVALGELYQARELADHVAVRFRYVKIGLSRMAQVTEWVALWSDLARRTGTADRWVAVVYADWQRAEAPSPEQVFRAAETHAARAVLWDTWQKDQPICHWMNWHELKQWNDFAKSMGMTTAVAGSLTADMFHEAIAAGADILAVRGAACRGGRNGTVCAKLVRELLERLPGGSN